jgi:hypothetical protein
MKQQMVTEIMARLAGWIKRLKIFKKGYINDKQHR